jgi:hypothetical protein
MISEDFANKLITLIKEHAWAVEYFPELGDETLELAFAGQLTQLIKACKKDIPLNEGHIVTVLTRLLNALDNKQARQDFFYDEIALKTSVMNAALFCTLSFRIASLQWKTSHPEAHDINFYHGKHNAVFKPLIDHYYFTDCEKDLTALFQHIGNHDWVRPNEVLVLKAVPDNATQMPLRLSSSTPAKPNKNSSNPCRLL